MRVNLLEEKRGGIKGYYFDALFVVVNLLLISLVYANASFKVSESLASLNSKESNLRSAVTAYSPYRKYVKEFVAYENELEQYRRLLSELKTDVQPVADKFFKVIDGVSEFGRRAGLKEVTFSRASDSIDVRGEALNGKALIGVVQSLSNWGRLSVEDVKRKTVAGKSFYDFSLTVRGLKWK